MTFTYVPEGLTYQGGFISFPSGTYTPDPTGTINFKNGTFVTQQTPVLYGGPDLLTPPFWDAAAGRWVPVSAGETAPDGSSYALATAASTVTVVDVRTASEKAYHVAIPSASPAGIYVENDDGSSVFFAESIVEGFPHGVWRLDLATGAVTDLAQPADVLAVRNGYAWTGAVDPHDPTPPQLGGPVLFDSINAVNLTSRATTNWYYTQARADYLLGFASGDRPIVAVSAGPDFSVTGAEIRLIDQPNTSAEDNGELVAPPGLSLAAPQADGDRTWFGGAGGIYMYTSSSGLQRVFAGGGDPRAGGQILPAGACR